MPPIATIVHMTTDTAPPSHDTGPPASASENPEWTGVTRVRIVAGSRRGLTGGALPSETPGMVDVHLGRQGFVTVPVRAVRVLR